MNRAHALAATTAFAIVTSLAVPAAAAPAADNGPLSIETRMLVEQRTRAADGTTRTEQVAPTKVVPGTPVTIVIDYRNTGDQPLGGVVIANPVPRNTVFGGVATGTPQPEVSVDGKTFASLAQLRVPATGGGTRAATHSDVTSVRWRLPSPLTAGSKGQFAFQAVLK